MQALPSLSNNNLSDNHFKDVGSTFTNKIQKTEEF